MPRESHICTACGYEGSPVFAPRDDAGEEDSLVVTVANKLFFLLTFVPIKFGWLVKLSKRRKSKYCPNCGLPFMVKLHSDAGWLAKRKNDIKAGLVVIVDGKAVAPDSPEAQAQRVHVVAEKAPVPEKLPSLEVLLADPVQTTLAEPKKDGALALDTAEKPPEMITKKPRANPDEW